MCLAAVVGKYGFGPAARLSLCGIHEDALSESLHAHSLCPGNPLFELSVDLGMPEEKIFTAPDAVDVTLFFQSSRKCAAQMRNPSTAAATRLPSRYFPLRWPVWWKRREYSIFWKPTLKLDAEIRSQIGLVFAGDGSEREELKERASKITRGTIQFLGFVHREELPELYALADGFVFPTHSDPWGSGCERSDGVRVANHCHKRSRMCPGSGPGWLERICGSSSRPLSAGRSHGTLAENSGLRATMAANSQKRIEASHRQHGLKA